MSFQAWAASWSAYTVATSGRIVPSSSSRAILPSTSADGASLIISPDTRCLAVSSLDSSGPWLQARLEQTGKGRSHVDEDRGPEYSHEEGQRKPARRHQDVESKNVDKHWRQHGHRQRYVTVDQQKYTCDDLKCEDHPQVMRDIKGAQELSSNAPRRGKRNEVQEAVQPHNEKDHARQISGDYGSDSHNRVLLFDRRNCMASIILMSI